jgi:hypothetical protein
VEFLVQWDDERVPRDQNPALFDAFSSADKTLRANPGEHGGHTGVGTGSWLRFLSRHLA